MNDPASPRSHLRVGLIGTGAIGREHALRLARRLAGVSVVAVTDVDRPRADALAAELPGVAVVADGPDLIHHPDVDAVLVTSSASTHAEHVLGAIAAGKPVFCEKPLATEAPPAQAVLDAEARAGRRLVSVGFMRRFDSAHRAVREVLAAGSVGAPLLVHAAHRNPALPASFTTETLINEAAVHEVDAVRWLLDEEIVAVTVHSGRRTRHAAHRADPVLLNQLSHELERT